MSKILPGLLNGIKQGDFKSLARGISLIENEYDDYIELLKNLPAGSTAKIIGITGAPGAGKSTLADALISEMIKANKKVGVICVDPSSPLTLGALLGDRVRMSEWYNNPHVFIRSLSSRGSLGGLHPKILEIADVMKAAGFDYVIIETVGVGQSEIEISALADTTVVVLVPEGGDEIQTMKAGIMEIADIFVVNKGDRPNADAFVKNLHHMQTGPLFKNEHPVQILKTVATENKGIDVLYQKIKEHANLQKRSDRSGLLAERAYYLIREHRMKNVDKNILKEQIEKEMEKNDFNLYKFFAPYLNE